MDPISHGEEELLHDVARQISRASGIAGITTAVTLAYEIVTEDNRTVIGSIYTGGKASAIGLTHIMRERLTGVQE